MFRLRLILCVAAPVEQWYRHQAHHCRAVQQNAAWFIVQASGEFFAHILMVAKVLAIERDLRWCGFSLPAQADECISDPGLMVIQDEMAKQTADVTWSLVTARLLRGMWIMRGWPNRFMASLSGGHKATQVICELRSDYEAFVAMRAAAAAGRPVQEWLWRSVFRLPVVIQLVRALRRRNWAPDQAFWQWLRRRCRRLTSSVLCEDGFNIAQNSRRAKGKKQYMRVQKAFTSIAVHTLLRVQSQGGLVQPCHPERGRQVRRHGACEGHRVAIAASVRLAQHDLVG